ncbi:hypothetical protein [Shimazuella soli]|nr:hypothetical protein [Shimazuella soli]
MKWRGGQLLLSNRSQRSAAVRLDQSQRMSQVSADAVSTFF